jgi:hypothetical protein
MTEAKESKTGWNDYSVQPDPDRSAIAELEWLEQLTDLDSLIRTKSVEEIEYILETGELPPADGIPEIKQEIKQEIKSKPESQKSESKPESQKSEVKEAPKSLGQVKEAPKSLGQEKDVNSLLAKLRSDRAERVKK